MRVAAFAIILLLAGIAIGVSLHAKPLPLLIDAPIHRADALAPPAWRLFTVCPVGRHNVPTLPDNRRA